MFSANKTSSAMALAVGAAAGLLVGTLLVVGVAPSSALFTVPTTIRAAGLPSALSARPGSRTRLDHVGSPDQRQGVPSQLTSMANPALGGSQVESESPRGIGKWESLAFNVASLLGLAGFLGAQRARRNHEERVGLAVASGSSDAPLEGSGESPLQRFLAVVSRVDFVLLAYFFFWYLGNYYYNIYNKVALNASGGAAGFPLTVATAQLLFAALYPLFLWVAPDARPAPGIGWADVKAMIPVSICAAGAHCSSVFALGAGAVSFAQIVKAAEPAFAAVLGTLFYGKVISTAKWLCLLPVIGGVALASVKELDFSWAALVAAAVANLFAAVKGNENKKLMETKGVKERLGSVGNQFAVTSLLSFLIAAPFALLREGNRFPEFLHLFANDPILRFNVIASGIVFYSYNELATLTIDKTNAVTQSVANTAKRVIVIVGVAIVLGESLDPLKMLGCAIGIGGVFLYSVIDQFVKPKK